MSITCLTCQWCSFFAAFDSAILLLPAVFLRTAIPYFLSMPVGMTSDKRGTEV